VRPSDFPATAAELADRASEGRLSAELVEQIRQLPDGRIYETVGELWDDLDHNSVREMRPGAHDPRTEGTA
jgi:hypothetical protein